jgi:quercetin dioxygenase-like cupin family protein
MIHNPVIRDTITFIKTSDETNGEYALFKVELARGGGNGMHYHRTFTEKFEVLKGRLNVSIDGDDQVLHTGQSALALPKVHHRFYNESDDPVTFTVEIRPARQFEKALRIGYGLATDGKTNARALPTNLWHLALLFEVAETYVPRAPWWMQQMVMGALARIARWLGKDKEVEKYL